VEAKEKRTRLLQLVEQGLGEGTVVSYHPQYAAHKAIEAKVVRLSVHTGSVEIRNLGTTGNTYYVDPRRISMTA